MHYTFTKDISTGRTETFKDAIQNVDKLKKVIFDLFYDQFLWDLVVIF